jgi:hypothetical protein
MGRWTKPENDQYAEDLHLAGERVQPGSYHQVGTARVVVLEQEDVLPASLDGRVACYTRLGNTWGEARERRSGDRRDPGKKAVTNGV